FGNRPKMRLGIAFWPLAFLLVYYLIWHFSNWNAIDHSDAFQNLAREILMIFFVGCNVYWIQRFNCLRRFTRVVYWAFALFMVFWLIYSIPQIDIIRTFTTFWIDNNFIRYRTMFGFEFPNLAAEMALSVIILSKIARPKKQGKVWTVLLNLVMLFIILANNSRGTFIAFVLVEVGWFILSRLSARGYQTFKRLLFILIALAIVGVVAYALIKHVTILELLSGTNRQGITENLTVLEASGRWWMGLGRLTGEFFADENIFYGQKTGYLEVFYFETFVTSGIIGSIYIVAILLFLGVRMIATQFSMGLRFGKWMLLVVLYSLFISLFEVYIFSYIYVTAMAFLIIGLSAMCKPKVRLALVTYPEEKGEPHDQEILA
nr:hypothetical protein [Bacilli bacterium]